MRVAAGDRISDEECVFIGLVTLVCIIAQQKRGYTDSVPYIYNIPNKEKVRSTVPKVNCGWRI